MKKFITKMIIPTVLMVWATTYFFEVLKYPPKNYILIKPVYFVMLAFYVLNTILDLIECIKDSEKSGETEKLKVSFKESVQSFLKQDKAKILYVFIAIFFASLTLKLLGFFIVIPVFLFAVLFIAGERNKLILTCMPIGTTVILYLIFHTGLKVLLPLGFLFD